MINTVEKIVNFNKQDKGQGLKLLTSKQMLQRLLIALAQVRAGNTSENCLNEIFEIIYFCIKQNKISKKVYNNIMNQIKMGTIFMNPESSKTSNHHSLNQSLDITQSYR